MKKYRNKDSIAFDNIKDIILNSAKLYGDKAAFIIKEGGVKSKTYITKTYNDLVNDVYAFGTAIFSMGLKGARIAVAGRNSYTWVLAYLSFLCGTNVVVPRDKELCEGEFEECLSRRKADMRI